MVVKATAGKPKSKRGAAIKRVLPKAKYGDQLIMSCSVADGADVRKMAQLNGTSQAELLRLCFEAAWPTVKMRLAVQPGPSRSEKIAARKSAAKAARAGVVVASVAE